MENYYEDTSGTSYSPTQAQVDEREERERLASQAEAEQDLKDQESEQAGGELPGGKPAEEQQKEQTDESRYDDGALGNVQRAADAVTNVPVVGQVAQAGAGVVDTVMDVVGLVPGAKGIDDWYDEKLGRDRYDGLNKFVRDFGALAIPAGGTGSLAVKGAMKVSKLAKLKKYRRLGEYAIDAGAGALIDSVSDKTREEGGNISTQLEEKLGFNIPWAIRPGDSEDVRFQKNMIEGTGIGLIAGGALEAINLSSAIAGMFRSRGRGAKLKGKDALGKAKVEGINAKDAAELGEDPWSGAIDTNEKIYKKAQDEEAVKRYENRQIDPETGATKYDPFYNEPAEPQARAVMNTEADPFEAKISNAKIFANADTSNGRPFPTVTDQTKEFLNAADTTKRGQLLDEVTDGMAGSVAIKTQTTTISAEEVEDAVNSLADIIYKESPEQVAKEMDKMKTDTVSMFNLKTLGEKEYGIATKAFRKVFDQLEVDRQKSSAMIVNQSAGDASDAARAMNLIDEAAMDSTRQQELVINNLRTVMEEIRIQQRVSGWRLNNKKLINRLSKAGAEGAEEYSAYLQEAGKSFDEAVKKIKGDVDSTMNTLLDITKKNNEFNIPAFKEILVTNGDANSIESMIKVLENNVGLVGKAFVDGKPKFPSNVLRELEYARYNSVLLGKAPISAAFGAFTGLVGKPVTTLLGSAGDNKQLQRSLSIYFGSVQANFQNAFKAMNRQLKASANNPRLKGGKSAQREGAGMKTLENEEALDAMSEIWLKKGDPSNLARWAVWNFTKGLATMNNSTIARAGITAMEGVDAFVRSFIASGNARARAYDEVFKESGNKLNKDMVDALQKRYYSEAFDENGYLKNAADVYAAKEINLQLDSALVSGLSDTFRTLPALKSIFMFPRTGMNAIQLAATFTPGGQLGLAIGKSRGVLLAKTQAQKVAAMAEHGMEYTEQGFKQLRAEYIGRERMGEVAVTMAGMIAFNGNLTGAGPRDTAERRRMENLGWRPYSIRVPGGQWVSYEGFEPFHSWLGLVGDITYQARRLDEPVFEEWLKTAGHALTSNITSKTFLSGLEPLTALFALDDDTALQRFMANQVNSVLPGAGIRSILSNTIVPQVKDVERNFWGYMANKNKFLFDDSLQDMISPWDGQKIRYYEPMTAAINALLPTFKLNGEIDPVAFRVLETGWDRMQNIYTTEGGEPISPEERNFINTYIGSQGGIRKEFEAAMDENDGGRLKYLKQLDKDRGLFDRPGYTDDNPLYQVFDSILRQRVREARKAWADQNQKAATKNMLLKQTKESVKRGNLPQARQLSEQYQNFPK